MNDVFLILTGLVLLVAGGEILVRAASQLSLKLGIKPIIVGLTVVAFGTSAPELAITIQASLAGSDDIAIANVVGSNIFNVLFILGLCALFKPLFLSSQIIRREIPVSILAAVLLYYFSFDLRLARYEGLILFFLLICYITWLVMEAKKNNRQDQELLEESRHEYKISSFPVLLNFLAIILGLAVIMVGSDFMVKGCVSLASAMGISETVIGLTIVSAGTSLPELVTSIMATIKGERDIAIGNVIGSNTFNILGIAGLSSGLMDSGIGVRSALLAQDFPLMLAAIILCLPFFDKSSSLGRLKGGLFLASYLGYIIYLIQASAP